LIRWRHPEKGLIAPSQFVPLAEEIGCIVPLGEWALREACTVAATWPDALKVAVNLSALLFRSPGLVDVVIGALGQSGLAAERLELEITEAVLLQDNETTLATLYGLRALGVRISMDDFVPATPRSAIRRASRSTRSKSIAHLSKTSPRV
jgi:EAL domain-containing protein (putative c-di-GMP-specific phosphodiesterase class I)